MFVRPLNQGKMYTSESQMVITMQLISLKSEPHTITSQRYSHHMLMICKQRTISKDYLQSQALYRSRKFVVLYVQIATGDAPSIYKSVQGTCNEFHPCIYYLLLCNNNY